MPDDRDLLAAELALGLLTGDERAASEELRRTDAAFSDQVAVWETRFADFYREIGDVPPDPAVWERILQRLGPAPVAHIPANDDRPRSGALGWKVATGVFGSLAAALALVLVVRPEAPRPPVVVQAPGETLVAQLASSEGSSILAARYDQAEHNIRIRATAIPAGQGEPELWVIPEGGAPVSLGLIARDGETRVLLDGRLEQLMNDGATLALTLEPREGAPHTAPTGDILGTARITRL